MKVRIEKATNNVNATFHNNSRITAVKAHRQPKCKGNGWNMLTESGEHVEWFTTKKAATERANAIGADVIS